jgi:hypothetical protein
MVDLTWQDIINNAIGLVRSLGLDDVVTAAVLIGLAGALVSWIRSLR